VEKSQGEALYDYFCDYIRAAVYETIISCKADSQHNARPDWFLAWKSQRLGIGDDKNNPLPQPPQTTTTTATTTLDPSLPPESVLRDDPRYGSFDDATGLPRTIRHNDDVVPLTKSATKRLRKLLDAHAKRHAKWKAAETTKNNTSGTTTTEEQQPRDSSSAETPPRAVDWDARLRDAPVVAGSFGKRQGLELQSDMGPFCHVFRI